MKAIIHENFVKNLIQRARLAPIVNIIMASLVFILLRGNVDEKELIYWGCLIVATTLLTGLLHIQIVFNFLKPKGVYGIFTFLTLLQAISWGMGILYFSTFIPIEYEILLVFIAGGISGGAVALLYPSVPLYIGYIFSMLAPTIANHSMQGNEFSMTVAMTCMVYLFTMMLTVSILNRVFSDLDRTRKIFNKQAYFIDSIYSAAKDISFITCESRSGDHNIVSISPGTENLFKCKSKKLIGRSIQAIPDKDVVAKWREDFTTVYSKGISVKGEIKFERPSGGVKYIEYSIYPIKNENDSICGLSIIAFDLTEFKQTESKMIEGREKFKMLFESAGDMIFIFNQDVSIIEANKEACELLGFSRDDLIAKNLSDITSTEFHERFKSWIKSAEIKSNTYFESEFKTNFERTIPVEISVKLVELNGETIVLSICRDITERKRTEELMRQSDDRYKTLIETMTEGLAIADLNENIIFANKSAGEIFGYSREKLIGTNFDQIVIKEDLKKIHEGTKKRVNGEHNRYNVRIRRPDDGIRNLEVSATPLIGADGNIQGSFGLFTDITDINKAESDKIVLTNQLNRAQKMESLAFLASGVAHDINKILGPMIAYPELMKMNLPADSPIKAQIEKIEQSAQKAADVVQDLMTMSSRGQYEMVGINLNELVVEALESSEIKDAKSKTQNVNISLSPDDSLPKLMGSRTHLLKVIRSLIINAINAVPEGGDVTIEITSKYCDKLLLGFANIEECNYAILTVTDTGEGLDEKDKKRIFEPFYTKQQLGRTGSGLGLAIAYGVIKDHNGYIDIQSEKCAGTTFIVYLPIQEVPSLEETKLILDIRGNEKILVVDDVEEQRELAATTLSSLGYQVDVVANGQLALEYCKENNPDVIILDMILTDGYDGLDTYREIIKFRPGQKAVIVSGLSSTDRVEEARKLGAGKFISKPYSMQILGKAIREVLSTEPVKPEKVDAVV